MGNALYPSQDGSRSSLVGFMEPQWVSKQHPPDSELSSWSEPKRVRCHRLAPYTVVDPISWTTRIVNFAGVRTTG